MTDPLTPRLIPAPSAPLEVATLFVEDRFTDPERLLHLRHNRGDFYRWDGSRWPEAEARGVREAMYEWLRDAVYTKQTPEGEELVPWNPTRHKIDDVLDALAAVVYLPGEIEAPAWLGDDDVDPSQLVIVENGILHIPTRRLRPHSPHLWSHHALPYPFDPQAPTPERWLRFLGELFGGDTEATAALQEVFGNLLGGDTRHQKIVLVAGPKRSGKGTTARVLTGLLGKHNVAAPTLASLGTNFGLQPLIDRPLAIVSDARLSTRADASVVVERLLSISGEDSLTVDRKYRDPWTGRLPTQILILTNELPKLTDSSGALASRFIVFTLHRSF
jgi:putative DNA primase/helicase